MVAKADADAEGGERQRLLARHRNTKLVAPFIDAVRVRHHGWVRGSPVPANMAAVVWEDGEYHQLAESIKPESESLWADNKVDWCKHNRARSHIEQANDRAPLFKIHRAADRQMALNSAGSITMTATVRRMLMQHPDLEIDAADLDAVSTFAGRQLDCAPRVYTSENIRAGHLANGQISKEGPWPCIQQMLVNSNQIIEMPASEHLQALAVMPEIVRRFRTVGRIRDSEFRELGLRVDLHPHTNKATDYDSSSPHLQRCFNARHPAQHAARAELAAAREAQRTEAAAAALAKATKVLTESSQLEAKLAGHVHAATLEQFDAASKGSAHLLESFVLARLFANHGAAKQGGHKKAKKKGKVGEARAGLDCNLLRAYNLRADAVVWIVPPLPAPTHQAPPTGPAPQAAATATVATATSRTPAELLDDDAWVALVDAAFLPPSGGRKDGGPVAQQASTLVGLLQARLHGHVAARAPRGKQDHWVWRFVRDNMGIVAAILACHGLVGDLEFATEAACLLSDMGNFQLAVDDLLKLQGAYTYWHKHCCVRSGTSCGADACFGTRHTQHTKCARLTKPADMTRFYLRYPCRESLKLAGKVARGTHEDLQMRVGVAFDRFSSSAVDAVCSPDLFAWSPETLTHMDAASFRGLGNSRSKKLVMVSYLLELALDLLIAPHANSSQAPGFETPLGCF